MSLTMMQVHAHPDDEASKGAGVTARYSAEGVRCVLVTCTGGEAGEILNPEVDNDETRANLHAIRLAELDESVKILGYDTLHLLGYRDSGMPETEPNKHPEAFANADLDEAVGRLVALIRAERPHVLLTYGEDHSAYPHPDHIRTHEISALAFDAAADRGRFPEAGEPWQISKLYYMVFSRRRVQALHDWLLAAGRESPFTEWLADRSWPDDDILRTRIDIGEHITTARAALRAHRTQIPPDSFFFAVPEEVVRESFPWEEYALARSTIPGTVPDDGYETDLFAGLR